MVILSPSVLEALSLASNTLEHALERCDRYHSSAAYRTKCDTEAATEMEDKLLTNVFGVSLISDNE